MGIEQVARELGVTVTTIRKMLRRGALRAVRQHGRLVFDRKQVAKLKAASKAIWPASGEAVRA